MRVFGRDLPLIAFAAEMVRLASSAVIASGTRAPFLAGAGPGVDALALAALPLLFVAWVAHGL